METSKAIQVINRGGIARGTTLFAVWGELTSGRIGDGRGPWAEGDALPLLPADATPRDRSGRFVYIATRDGQALRFPIRPVRLGSAWWLSNPWYLGRNRQGEHDWQDNHDGQGKRGWSTEGAMSEGDRVLAVGFHRSGQADVHPVFMRDLGGRRYLTLSGRLALFEYLNPRRMVAVLVLWGLLLLAIPFAFAAAGVSDPYRLWQALAALIISPLPWVVAAVMAGPALGEARRVFEDHGGFEPSQGVVR